MSFLSLNLLRFSCNLQYFPNKLVFFFHHTYSAFWVLSHEYNKQRHTMILSPTWALCFQCKRYVWLQFLAIYLELIAQLSTEAVGNERTWKFSSTDIYFWYICLEYACLCVFILSTLTHEKYSLNPPSEANHPVQTEH